MVKGLCTFSGTTKHSQPLAGVGCGEIFKNGHLELKYGKVWAQRAICRPADSILRPTSLSWIHTMTIKGLITYRTHFGASHKPNNTVRSGQGLYATVSQTDQNGQLWTPGGSAYTWWGATGHQRLTLLEECHSRASSMPTAISEFQNKLFHGLDITVNLTFSM